MKSLIRRFPILLLSAFLLVSCSDECDDVNCQNGGTCDDGVCQCPDGYIGDECQTEDRAKFLGVYNVSESCDSGNANYQMTVSPSNSGIRTVLLVFQEASLTANVNGNSINMPNQTVSIQNSSYTFSGSGQISGSILTMTYTASVGAESIVCTITATKL